MIMRSEGVQENKLLDSNFFHFHFFLKKNWSPRYGTATTARIYGSMVGLMGLNGGTGWA